MKRTQKILVALTSVLLCACSSDENELACYYDLMIKQSMDEKLVFEDKSQRYAFNYDGSQDVLTTTSKQPKTECKFNIGIVTNIYLANRVDYAWVEGVNDTHFYSLFGASPLATLA